MYNEYYEQAKIALSKDLNREPTHEEVAIILERIMDKHFKYEKYCKRCGKVITVETTDAGPYCWECFNSMVKDIPLQPMFY